MASSKPLGHVLKEKGDLSKPPNVATGRRSEQLIDEFVRKYSENDEMIWSVESARAKSNLVNHKEDHSLRIDLQPAKSGWANLQLQAGSKSIACVLMICGKKFCSSEVKAAWLDSLQNTQNAEMIWRFRAKPIDIQVLNSLGPWKPREMNLILDALIGRESGAAIPHLEYLQGRIKESLHDLKVNGLVIQQGEGWLLTPKGVEYV